ncbi:BRO family protein [Exercitatus varius]|uniref:BRO family protein n=1 Tax=Exercitatus varius TaxID=67857 RepID=UPI00374F2A92
MNEIKLFENQQIRSAWDEEKQEWFFSVVDIVAILTESLELKQYIKKMRSRDHELNSKWGTICTPVVMIAKDGKKRSVQAADMTGIFRIIQSIPSPKTEPFKMWLAEVGKEQIDEIVDPELTIDRALETYLKKGYSKESGLTSACKRFRCVKS